MSHLDKEKPWQKNARNSKNYYWLSWPQTPGGDGKRCGYCAGNPLQRIRSYDSGQARNCYAWARRPHYWASADAPCGG